MTAPAKQGKTTLDNLHSIQISNLQEQKSNLKSLLAQITDLEKKANLTNDLMLKMKYEEQIFQLRKKKGEIESDKPIYDYFFEAGDLLYNYYEIQDKIQKGEKSKGKPAKIKPGSVLAALNTEEEEEKVERVDQTEHIEQSEPKIQGREVLLEKYLQIIDPEHAKSLSSKLEDPTDICPACDKEMVFSANEALFYCQSCGNQEFVLIDSDKPSYKDPPREVTYYAYKRINHFNEWLAQFQAKESTEIPEEVFQEILNELRKERISDPSSIKQAKILEILKKLKCTNYYKHAPYILNRINGNVAPVMPRDVEEKLRFMFREIQSSFIKHCPKTRSNFLSYSYVLYKFCELLELDDYLKCFSLLKNRDKLYVQDKIWQKICEDLKWQFIKSI